MSADEHDTCGCCAPIASPEVYNPPGAASVRYRIDRHAGFLARMLARLPRDLPALTTHAPNDPSIAVLDGWAVLGDILTFYQERIANEGFLSTSTERRSIHELAAMIGYQLKPGVAASAYLAFTIETPVVAPSTTPGATPPMTMTSPPIVPVPIGTRVQSTPGPGELPQTFETVEELTARVAWNTIRARLSQRQQLGIDSGAVTWRRLDGTRPNAKWIWLATTTANLSPGDWLVVEVKPDNRHASDPVSAQVTPGVAPVRVRAVTVDNEAGTTQVELIQPSAAGLAAFELSPLTAASIVTTPLPLTATNVRAHVVEKTWTEPELTAQIAAQRWNPERLTAQVSAVLGQAPAPATVSVLRQSTAVFGAVAPPYATLPAELVRIYPTSWDTTPRSVWQKSNGDRHANADVFLDRVVDGLVPGGWVLFSQGQDEALFRIDRVITASLSDFATSARCTGLELLHVDGTALTDYYKTHSGAEWKFRTTTVRVLSQALPISAAPVTLPLGPTTTRIITDRMVLGLRAGQVVALSGDALDAAGASLGPTSELATIDRVEHAAGLSIIYLDEPLTHRYGRSTFALCANLARATHGDTVTDEQLGSTDGTPYQARLLKRPPLTLVSAPTAEGTASTLTVRVGGVAWREVPTLLDADPTERVFQTRTNDEGKTMIVFGDGAHGAPPATGRDNLTATYRTGMGLSGNVAAGKLTLLAKQPLGVRGVTNPAAASGAEDPEPVAAARRNAPRTVRTLDRVVSLADYEDFARGFAGIAKARGGAVWDGQGRLVHVTIAGFDGAPIATTSELYRNLIAAIRRSSDGIDRFVVADFVPRQFVLEATLRVHRDHRPEDVAAAARARTLATCDFDARQLAQPITEAEVMQRLMALRGIVAVKVTRLHRTDRSNTVEAVIAAGDARWDASTGLVRAAELLTLLPANLRLTAVSI